MEQEYTFTLEIQTPVKDVLKRAKKEELIKSVENGIARAGSEHTQLVESPYIEKKAEPAILLLDIVLTITATAAAVIKITKFLKDRFGRSEVYIKTKDKRISLKGYSGKDVVRILKELHEGSS